jgi:hypothetical protein
VYMWTRVCVRQCMCMRARACACVRVCLRVCRCVQVCVCVYLSTYRYMVESSCQDLGVLDMRDVFVDHAFKVLLHLPHLCQTHFVFADGHGLTKRNSNNRWKGICNRRNKTSTARGGCGCSCCGCCRCPCGCGGWKCGSSGRGENDGGGFQRSDRCSCHKIVGGFCRRSERCSTCGCGCR